MNSWGFNDSIYGHINSDIKFDEILIVKFILIKSGGEQHFVQIIETAVRLAFNFRQIVLVNSQEKSAVTVASNPDSSSTVSVVISRGILNLLEIIFGEN
jgi:hypothetical protein